jgi:two-component system, cell cycle response regulator
VVVARNGDEALHIAAARTLHLMVVAVLPELDGLHVLETWRAVAGGIWVPAIVTLTRDDREQRLRALRLGAEDVLLKPLDLEDLVARVRRSLAAKHRLDALLAERSRLERLSITDGLTQLHNHRFFQERFRDEFRRAQRYDDPLALMLMDLDHFKQVNDTHGHPAGDQVLKDVAGCLRKCVRETDMVARYGGEEFAVLLPKTHLSGALTVAERVRRDVGSLKTGLDGGLRITVSVGVAGYPCRSIATAEQMLRAADEALYRAKHEGRNKICLFPPSLEADPAVSAPLPPLPAGRF